MIYFTTTMEVCVVMYYVKGKTKFTAAPYVYLLAVRVYEFYLLLLLASRLTIQHPVQKYWSPSTTRWYYDGLGLES